MDVIPEDAGNPEISSPVDVFPVDGSGGVEGCPSSGAEVGAEVGVGVPVGSPSGGGGSGGGADSAVTCEDVEMMLDGCDSLDESESLEGINALQMASPENSSTTIAANTTIFFFHFFVLSPPIFLYRFL